MAWRVTNIAAHLPEPMSVTAFMDRVMAHVCPGASPSDLALTDDEAHLHVASGVIRAARLLGDYFGRRDVAGLEAALVSCRHDRDALAERLGEIELGEYLLGVGVDELIECLF